MVGFALQDFLIFKANTQGTLRIFEKDGRFGKFAYIADEKGIIEVFDDVEACNNAVESAMIKCSPTKI